MQPGTEFGIEGSVLFNHAFLEQEGAQHLVVAFSLARREGVRTRIPPPSDSLPPGEGEL